MLDIKRGRRQSSLEGRRHPFYMLGRRWGRWGFSLSHFTTNRYHCRLRWWSGARKIWCINVTWERERERRRRWARETILSPHGSLRRGRTLQSRGVIKKRTRWSWEDETTAKGCYLPVAYSSALMVMVTPRGAFLEVCLAWTELGAVVCATRGAHLRWLLSRRHHPCKERWVCPHRSKTQNRGSSRFVRQQQSRAVPWGVALWDSTRPNRCHRGGRWAMDILVTAAATQTNLSRRQQVLFNTTSKINFHTKPNKSATR